MAYVLTLEMSHITHSTLSVKVQDLDGAACTSLYWSK